MRIERIDEVLKIYDENFPKKYEMDPRLEFILAQALLVVIYSEFEKKFKIWWWSAFRWLKIGRWQII